MFAIYDIQGCSFRYTLKNVSMVREAQDSAQTRSATNASEQEPRLIPDNTSGKTGKAQVSGKDIEAYSERHHLNQRNRSTMPANL